jgi:hypothetical protein
MYNGVKIPSMVFLCICELNLMSSLCKVRSVDGKHFIARNCLRSSFVMYHIEENNSKFAELKYICLLV